MCILNEFSLASQVMLIGMGVGKKGTTQGAEGFGPNEWLDGGVETL